MTNYKTFKQLVVELSNVRTKEDLNAFCADVDIWTGNPRFIVKETK